MSKTLATPDVQALSVRAGLALGSLWLFGHVEVPLVFRALLLALSGYSIFYIVAALTRLLLNRFVLNEVDEITTEVEPEDDLPISSESPASATSVSIRPRRVDGLPPLEMVPPDGKVGWHLCFREGMLPSGVLAKYISGVAVVDVDWWAVANVVVERGWSHAALIQGGKALIQPVALWHDVSNKLVEAGILHQVASGGGNGYAPTGLGKSLFALAAYLSPTPK